MASPRLFPPIENRSLLWQQELGQQDRPGLEDLLWDVPAVLSLTQEVQGPRLCHRVQGCATASTPSLSNLLTATP